LIEKHLTLLEIITYGNPILTRRAAEIKDIDQKTADLARNMIYTMHRAPGIGLAAPQVKESIRLITVDLSVGEDEKELIILANPEILSVEGEETLEEGCLSVPNIAEKVTRPFRVQVRGWTLDGKEARFDAEGLLARVFCHEVDHLNGKLFIDHLSPLKKNLAKKKLKKAN